MTFLSQLRPPCAPALCHSRTTKQVLSKAAVHGTPRAYLVGMNATQTVKKTFAALAIMLVLVSGNAAQIKTTTGRRDDAMIAAIT